jgi:MarR family transcriptional regulator, organic hydroperoxide resistance regulator
MRVSNEEVAAVQRDYPKIYLACHTRHVRRRSTKLTGQDSTLLAHLSADCPTRASALARHLGVGASTLSAAIKRLIDAGYITRGPDASDRRAAALRLSAAGVKAMQGSSVLDATRVARMLAQLGARERQRALDGLALLAKASLNVPKAEP